MTCAAKPDALPAESEASLLAKVTRTARLLGWMVYHTWRSDHSERGFPDLVLVKGNKIIFWELKADKGKLSPEQREWLTALEAVETVYQVGCVRPRDWPEIEATLKGER